MTGIAASSSTRRKFLQASTAAAIALPCFSPVPSLAAPPRAEIQDEGFNIIGPKPGYSPQIGTLVSMLTWMRTMVLSSVKGMSQKDLDWLLDAKANSIGALLLHLAATETYYQFNTLDGMAWRSWSDAVKQKWDPAMGLGEEGRQKIKGNTLDYCLDILHETREKSLAEFRKRDDNWLMSVDKTWPWGPTNNYCKWFHVCEHESNHNGQIKLLAKRLPGAKPDSE